MRCLGILVLFATAIFQWSAPAKADMDAGSQQPKKWTFLMFLNGNNSLDNFATFNLNEMEKVGSSNDVNVVVEWGSQQRGTVERLYVRKGGEPGQTSGEVVQNLGKADMGDWHTLLDFINWGVAHYPAQHYFIAVWDHGMGWHELDDNLDLRTEFFGLNAAAKPRVERPQDISTDENSGNTITTEQLGQVMSAAAQTIGNKVDIYGSDACLMGMAEVAGEMQDSVQTFVGSEEVEPAEGWPYVPFLTKWENNPAMDSNAIAKMLVDEYAASFNGGEHGTDDVTLSAFDLTGFADFTTAVSRVSNDLLEVASRSAEKLQVLSAAENTIHFEQEDYGDLGDFLSELSKVRMSEQSQNDVAMLQSAIQQLVVANGTTPKYSAAGGISIWLPSDGSYTNHAERYAGLRFARESGWGKLLKALYTGSTPAPGPVIEPGPRPKPIPLPTVLPY